ncbi:carboxymuconolactone decarboxylase family protein [soil metagenome]
MSLKIHIIETAPERSAPVLEQVKSKFGFVPNLMGVFAESPEALQGYLTLSSLVDQTDLTPTERQIILLATSRTNGCEYCIAAHTTISSMQNVPTDVVQAVRDNTAIPDSKLEALRAFTAAVVEKRGFVSDEDKNAFLTAGYSERNILDVILGVSMKTLSNYTNHIAETPLDAAFEPARWKSASA